MNANPYGVRHVDGSEIDPLVAAVTEIFGEVAVQPVSESRVRDLCVRCMTDGVVGVVGHPGEIQASIGIEIAYFDYSEEIHLRIAWIGVLPPWRRSNHAATLLRFARWFHAGIERRSGQRVPCVADIVTTSDLDRKIRSFGRQMRQVGATFGWGFPDHMTFLSQEDIDAATGTKAGAVRCE